MVRWTAQGVELIYGLLLCHLEDLLEVLLDPDDFFENFLLDFLSGNIGLNFLTQMVR